MSKVYAGCRSCRGSLRSEVCLGDKETDRCFRWLRDEYDA